MSYTSEQTHIDNTLTYMGRTHTQNTRGGTELWPRRVCSPTSVRRSTQPCLFHTLFWLPITTTPSILGPGPRAHTLAVVRTLVSHHSPFPFPVSKRNYQVHKCQDFIDKWENCCNNAKKEAAVCAAQGKPYTWTKG